MTILPEAAPCLEDAIVRRAGLAGLVEQTSEPPQFGLLGRPRVNVLLLNLVLAGLTKIKIP